MQIITQLNQNSSTWIVYLLSHRRRLRQASLVLLFLMALLLRIYDLNRPGILPEREFRSMFIARANYYEHVEVIPDWQREVALTNLRKLGTLEPPILEILVANLYVIAGGEYVQIARIVSAVFWLFGSVLLFKIARKLMRPGAAILATAYYLFVPLGILTSRSFQPDSLMIMLFVASLFRYPVVR